MRWGVAAIGTLAGWAVVGCDRPAQGPADTAEEILCPELSGNADPLELSYSDKPSANGRIRAFVSAARGLNDVSVQIEKLAVDACGRIRRDLGAPPAPANASIDVQCEPLRTLLGKLAKDGVEVRIGIAPPRCEADSGRKARCDSVAEAGGGAEGKVLCDAEAAVYARCSLPSISFAASRNVGEVITLGRTLEENLPTLLYAEMALAARLLEHTQQMVAASTQITAQVKDAGPHGLACIGLAAAVTVKSAERVKSFVATSAALVAGLDPEVQPAAPPRGAP